VSKFHEGDWPVQVGSRHRRGMRRRIVEDDESSISSESEEDEEIDLGPSGSENEVKSASDGSDWDGDKKKSKVVRKPDRRPRIDGILCFGNSKSCSTKSSAQKSSSESMQCGLSF
jgi:hypothetical protein